MIQWMNSGKTNAHPSRQGEINNMVRNVSFEEAIQESGSLLTNLTDNPELQNEYMNQLYDNFIGYSVAGAATVGILLWILFS